MKNQLLVAARGGNIVDLENLKPSDINFKDIFTTLSKKGRYNDNSDRKVSVLDHEILAYTLAFAHGNTDAVQLAALIHDSGEAFTGDIPTPVKVSTYVRPIHDLESKIDKPIFQQAFRTPNVDYKALLKSVKFYDRLALTLELPYAWERVDPYWNNFTYSPEEMKQMNFPGSLPNLDKLFGHRRKAKIEIAMDLIQIFWNTEFNVPVIGG